MNEFAKKFIFEKNFIITSHVFVTGPSQDLRDYLVKNRANKVLFVGHPLFYEKQGDGSGYEYYENGKKVFSKYTKVFKMPLLFKLIHDTFYTLSIVLKTNKHWDVYIGSNSLNTFSGLILRKFGFVNKVAYYVIDYKKRRFNNIFYNYLYHSADYICSGNSYEVWNLSPRMITARKEFFGWERGVHKVIPVGVWYNRMLHNKTKKFDKHTLGFVGHILEKQGIQYVIKALPTIKKTIPDIKLLIIGKGPYIPDLKKLCSELNLESEVQFLGYIESHKLLEEKLMSCAAGIALYEKYDTDGDLTFTYFADPSKLKIFMACGLPVFVSDVPYNAFEIENSKCGIVIPNFDPKVIADKVTQLLCDDTLLLEYRKNVINYSAKFNWENIFSEALLGLYGL
jgi:glycosyltransferase involved in cell wall biosynthesis